MYPLWLVHYLFSQLSGKEHVPFPELLNGITSDSNINKRTSDEILGDMLPVVEMYRMNEGHARKSGKEGV